MTNVKFEIIFLRPLSGHNNNNDDDDNDDDDDDDDDDDNNNNNNKGKEVPLQAWSGPEGSRRLRFPDFMTTAQDGGKIVNLTHRPPLPPGNASGIHFC